MAYRSFEVTDRRGLRRASARDFPNLAVIAGPNGSGKSTLLHELYLNRDAIAETGTDVAYIGPHRSWRRTKMTMYGLGEMRSTLSDYLRAPTVPHWKDYQPPQFQYVEVGAQRDPRGPDESFSFVKSSILKVDFQLRNRLREVWESEGQRIERGQVPDVFKPLKEALRALLPHLDFASINFDDDSDLRVYFRRVDGQYEDLVELDDLSSGEKSAISLILPTVERQIARLLGSEEGDGPLPTTLIDEPETHLHPSLQVLLLDYLQGLAQRNEAQFILSTHSPTIVDSLTEGLYLLAPSSQVPDGNQLLPLTSQSSRLDAMRALTGATHLITRCRPIVYLEGERPTEKPISDQRLVEMLVPQSAGWVLVSAAGQRQVVASADKLREAVSDVIPGLPVFALVDADQHQSDDPDWVVSWPVCMIENLLLDSDAIWQVLKPHREHVELASAGEIEQVLLNIAASLIDDEIRLRIPALQSSVSVRVRPENREDLAAAVQRAHEDFEAQIDKVRARLTTADWDRAEAEVRQIISEGRQLEAFRGKQIFNEFFAKHANAAGQTKKSFAYAVASHAATRPRCKRLVDAAVKRISTYVPVELVESAEALVDQHDHEEAVQGLKVSIEVIRSARTAWERGEDLPRSTEELRSIGVSLALAADDFGKSALAESLRRATSRLGARTAVRDSQN